MSLADLMIKWEAHGLERIRVRRAVAAAEAAAATAAATAATTTTTTTLILSETGEAKGTKRPLETGQVAGGVLTAGVGVGVAGGGGAGGLQGREKMMRTAAGGAVPGTGAGLAREGSTAGLATAEGTTDSFTLNRSSVRGQGVVVVVVVVLTLLTFRF